MTTTTSIILATDARTPFREHTSFEKIPVKPLVRRCDPQGLNLGCTKLSKRINLIYLRNEEGFLLLR